MSWPQFKLEKEDLLDLNQKQSLEILKELGGIEEIASGVGSNLNEGLSKQEAETQFIERKQRYGENVYPEPPHKNIFQLFIESLKDTTIIILIVSAIISLILGILVPGEEGSQSGWIEGAAILMAVLIVACVTAGNNYSKEKQFRSLNKIKNNRRVKVIRGGDIVEVSIFDILVGDVVSLDTGDQIPADGLYISGHELRVDESSMTGESDAVKKNTDKPFMLSGCQVAEGIGTMLVTGVGENSKWGRTLASLNEEQPETPLQEKLDGMAKTIGKFGLAVAILVFLALTINWGIQLGLSGNGWKWGDLNILVNFFIIAVTIVVVAVPEGLPLAVTISLAYSVKKMMTDNNLVRQLAACETMGGATNICSDKTGTLTENRMSVRQGWIAGNDFDIEKGANLSISEKVKTLLAEGIAINSTAQVVINPGKPHEYIGNKTECALLVFISDYCDYRSIRKKHEVYKLYPFSSARKRMSTVVQIENGYRIYTKGASEIILELCSSYINGSGTILPLTPELKDKLLKKIDTMADLALRTMCLAYRDFTKEPDWTNPPEENLVCVGIVGIKDPLRKEVPDAVAACQRAGIFVRMVTGDNLKTAKRIAHDCGILSSHGIAMEGPEFDALSEEELDNVLPRLQVLARSAPEHKLKLVKRLMYNGEVVAVTGDGTNDAPALKAADVGLAMGISGTEVAKEASKIVIMDDNFNSIKQSVLWGRCVYDNIRKFLQFQLTVNVVALVVAFIGALTGRGTPLKTVQLLWVNLIMDTMAALALGTEKPTPALLFRKPYGRDTPLISYVMWRNIFGQSLFQLFVEFVILYSGHLIWDVGQEGSVQHYTIIFNTFVLCQVFNEVNCRKVNDEFNVFDRIWTNYIFLGIVFITIVFQFIIVQFGGEFSQTQALTVGQWFSCIGIGFLSLPVGLLIRLIPVPKSKAELKPNPNDALFDVNKDVETNENIHLIEHQIDDN